MCEEISHMEKKNNQIVTAIYFKLQCMTIREETKKEKEKVYFNVLNYYLLIVHNNRSLCMTAI